MIHNTIISLIAALSENRVIGKDNRLPWHIPEDLKRFKQLTSGHPIIMGRKTFESIGRVLSNRTNIIVTRGQSYEVDGAIIAHSLDEALRKARDVIASETKPGTRRYLTKQSQIGEIATVTKGDLAMTMGEIFIIGGGQIFEQALPIADRLYLTIVHTIIDGDAYFPEYSEFTKVLSREDGENEKYKYIFITLEKE